MMFSLSFSPSGDFAATEARALVPHAGDLYCGMGQWQATDKTIGPQIIRLNTARGQWVVDFTFPPGKVAVASFEEVRFPHAKTALLMAGFFGGGQTATKVGDQWVLSPQTTMSRGEVRSFGCHTDRVTQTDMVFAGHKNGIFAGVYDETQPGLVSWNDAPELDMTSFPPMAISGKPVRVMAFAEDRFLYASIGWDIWRRRDGRTPSWAKVWTEPSPGASDSGLRGLTSIGGKLWTAVTGAGSHITSLDPTDWSSTIEFQVMAPGERHSIVAYNDFCVTTAADGSSVILAGLGSLVTEPGHFLSCNKGVWKRQILPALASQPMGAVRTIAVSPFVGSPFAKGRIYFGGYDCGGSPAMNTAWVAVGDITDAIGA